MRKVKPLFDDTTLEQANKDGIRWSNRVATAIKPIIAKAAKEGVSLQDMLRIFEMQVGTYCAIQRMRTWCAEGEERLAEQTKRRKKA